MNIYAFANKNLIRKTAERPSKPSSTSKPSDPLMAELHNMLRNGIYSSFLSPIFITNICHQYLSPIFVTNIEHKCNVMNKCL